jgi:hypothetical protein
VLYAFTVTELIVQSTPSFGIISSSLKVDEPALAEEGSSGSTGALILS